MKMRVYIDHNMIDNISKGLLVLKPAPSIIWVYSDEHFNEIQRAGDTRFLEVLGNLRAQKLELASDDALRITGDAHLLGEAAPQDLYDAWCRANAEVKLNGDYFSPILSRILGADNLETLSSLPKSFEQEVSALFESVGLLDDVQKERLAIARDGMESMVVEHLAELPDLESQREVVGTHGGRGSGFVEQENPLESLGRLIERAAPGVTADQLYGFDPPDKEEYDVWPLFLGIAGCYFVLNMIGLRPDKKLTKVERMPAIVSDAFHAGYAAYCHALLSADRRFCQKAKAIYRYKKIGTHVLRWERKVS